VLLPDAGHAVEARTGRLRNAICDEDRDVERRRNVVGSIDPAVRDACGAGCE
jgi:hypothetical protein